MLVMLMRKIVLIISKRNHQLNKSGLIWKVSIMLLISFVLLSVFQRRSLLWSWNPTAVTLEQKLLHLIQLLYQLMMQFVINYWRMYDNSWCISHFTRQVLFDVMFGLIFIILVLFFVINLFLKDVVLQVFILFFHILIRSCYGCWWFWCLVSRFCWYL